MGRAARRVCSGRLLRARLCAGVRGTFELPRAAPVRVPLERRPSVPSRPSPRAPPSLQTPQGACDFNGIAMTEPTKFYVFSESAVDDDDDAGGDGDE